MFSSLLRAADTNAAAGDQFTSATVSQREQDDVFAMAMARQLTGTKLAVFELDAIPRSFPLAHYRGGLVGVVHGYIRRVPGAVSLLKAAVCLQPSRIG